MRVQIPVGEGENERLEVKSVEALRHPESIGRAVVAMLNSAGGEVWVGLRDEDGVAVEMEPVADPERARAALRDVLVDRIEPRPVGDEVVVDTVGKAPVAVLRVSVRPQATRRPYALRSREGRLYLARAGARNRPLDRNELQAMFSPQPGEVAEATLVALEDPLRRDLREVQAAPEPTLWLGAEIAPVGELDLAAVAEGPYLVEPASTGNAAGGLGFLSTFYAAHFLAQREGTPYLKPPRGGWLEAGAGAYRLRVGDGGALRAEAPLAAFRSPGENPRSARLPELLDSPALLPEPLLRYAASVLRLAGTLLRETGLWAGPPAASDGFAAAIALVGVEGWFLRPEPGHPLRTYPVDPLTLRLRPPEVAERPIPAISGSVSGGPLRFTVGELRDNPDRCTYRLMQEVFAAFGYWESQIPYFDRRSERFDL